MNDGLDGIAAALDALRRAADGRAAGELPPAQLLAVNEAFGALRRHVDAAYAPVAAEISRQSRSELGGDSLSRKQGYRTPATLISATTGATVGDAVRIVAVGDATAPQLTLTGERMPAKRPYVASALRAGRIGMPAAGAICGLLDRVAIRAEASALDAMERTLVDSAPGLTPDQLQKLIVRAEAHLDPDGVEPREHESYGDRSVVFREERSGMIVMTGRFDAETGAPIKAAVEGIVGGMLRRADEAQCEDAPSGPVVEEQRSARQMQADALSTLCRHALSCTDVPTGPSTTVVVRVDLADLERGVGIATIDGIAQPLSAAAARRMAADAEIIPCVLGGDSEVLDWGRAKRLFTPAQKLALAERDGGCAFCGLPPGFAVGHHIRWWARDRGRTDLGNGILLCTACHHRLHDDGWAIRIEGPGTTAKVWFIPPPWLDTGRTPRLGGRARYDLVA